MKKIILIVILMIIAAGVVLGLKFLSGNQNQQNQNQPSDIIVSSPQPNQIITSPLLIEGSVSGGKWFFEGSFPIKILDSQGKEIATSIVQAQNDWMTTEEVNFKGVIRFISPGTGNGTLVLKNDNPSGRPDLDTEFRVPIKFDASQTMKVKVFFNNNNLDPQISCNKVFAVEREVPKTEALARAALEELLAGATFQEQNDGYNTSISSGVKIQKLTIDPPGGGGVAKVDFDEQLEFQIGGSCRVAAIRAQITQTLKQFSNVKEVIISINGRTEDILQP